jgi:hypothetical protein
MATHRLKAHTAVEYVRWSDLSPTNASRLNPLPGNPQVYWRVLVPPSGGYVTFSVLAVDLVAGVTLGDGSLGGKLFNWSWGDCAPASLPQVAITTSVGSSATATMQWCKDQAGLWLLTCRREDNGSAAVPIACEVA